MSQAEQAVAPDQQREFAVNFQDRKSGEMRLSIKVPHCAQNRQLLLCLATFWHLCCSGTFPAWHSSWHIKSLAPGCLKS